MTLWESRAAAEALEASEPYRRTVAAIEAAGVLEGESHVETFDVQGTLLGTPFSDAVSRIG